MPYYRTTGLMGDPVPEPPSTFYADLGDNIKSLVMTGLAGWILVHLWKMTGSKRQGITVRL